MSAPRPAPRRLRRRLMLAFSGFALLVTALFGLYVVVFVYLVEDRFFQELLQQESGRQLQQYARDGHWAPAQLPFVSVHADAAGLPDGLGARLAAEPWRREFDGPQGRHYHLQLLQPAPPAAPAWLVAEVSQHLVVRPMRGGILQWLAWSAAAVLVLALLLAAWLARRMSAPLSRLAQQIEQADPARLPAAIARGFGDDEVGTLARGLEALITRIEAFVAREREFTGDASHELRTPLAVIRSACERIIARGALDPAVQGQFEHIRQSALQLEQTVATLLALAREQNAGEAVVEVALLPLLERVIVDQAEVLDGRALELRLQVPAQARARVPPTVLHIVLSNLLGNAFAHGHDGVIVIDLDDGWLRISNPGERLSETAFEAFAKGQASAGFGLGLAIVRRLCERHRIALEYRYEDAASVVRIGLAAAC